jgi:TRAP-type mannitol/chloroaromatic compound transport system permease large subunit
MLLFVMKGVAPAGTKIKAIYLAGLPFLLCDLVALIVVLLVPETTTWLQDALYK